MCTITLPKNMQDISVKVRSYIGFAIRSNSVIWGLDDLMSAGKRAALIIKDVSLGQASLRKFNTYIADKNIPVFTVEEGWLISVTHRDRVKIIGITDENLAKAIMQNIKEGIINGG